MPNDFGPYKLTPRKVLQEIEKGRDVGPSAIDVLPMKEQLDYEEIRGMVIRRMLNKKKKKQQDTLWPERG